jgi:hypothetical protein
LVPGRGGYELVPPAGVPLWTQCAQTADALRCHDLAGSHDVPVGTPIYRLTTSSEWIAVPRKTSTPVDVARLFHAILGRDLTPPESRLLFDLAVVSATESGPTSIATGTVATVSP